MAANDRPDKGKPGASSSTGDVSKEMLKYQKEERDALIENAKMPLFFKKLLFGMVAIDVIDKIALLLYVFGYWEVHGSMLDAMVFSVGFILDFLVVVVLKVQPTRKEE